MSQPAAHLNLWKHRLGQVPESLFDQVDLETLVLADNDLTAISPAIARLKRLRMLDLGHNTLREVPESLGDLESLSDFLYLHDNCLASLPASLARLKRLRYLNIGGNEFESLPECICAMHSLVELRASDNPISALPDRIRQLTALRELHLRNTPAHRWTNALCAFVVASRRHLAVQRLYLHGAVVAVVRIAIFRIIGSHPSQCARRETLPLSVIDPGPADPRGFGAAPQLASGQLFETAGLRQPHLASTSRRIGQIVKANRGFHLHD
jgi:hypothetical protein